MILLEKGDFITTQAGKIAIGDRIIATDSDYAGLKGRITEIRTGADKETENETDDVYCCFACPNSKEEIRLLEEHFSALYGAKKRLAELGLDCVIMASNQIAKEEKI